MGGWLMHCFSYNSNPYFSSLEINLASKWVSNFTKIGFLFDLKWWKNTTVFWLIYLKTKLISHTDQIYYNTFGCDVVCWYLYWANCFLLLQSPYLSYPANPPANYPQSGNLPAGKVSVSFLNLFFSLLAGGMQYFPSLVQFGSGWSCPVLFRQSRKNCGWYCKFLKFNGLVHAVKNFQVLGPLLVVLHGD